MKFTVGQILIVFAMGCVLLSCSKTTAEDGKTLLPASPQSEANPLSRDPETAALISAVSKTGAKSIQGKLVSRICEIARPHLDYMIERKQISHDNYDKRTELLYEAGGSGSGEIVAYNCSGSMTATKGAESCANSWINSPGHWELMKKRWDGYCYAMKRTGNCYYCIGLFSNGSW